MIKKSEVACYKYILDEILKKGWDKKNVYTQQECLTIEEVKKYLVLDRPENVIKVKEEIFYVIEGKNEKSKIEIAIDEAKNQYAKKINQSKKIKVLFVTGVAGNEDEGYISKSYYFNGSNWDLIKENDVEITSILSLQQIDTILKNKSALIEDIEISEDEFLKTAIEVNKILHENSINKDYRARFMSAILLSMTTGENLNLNENALVLINNVNKKVELILRNHKKQDFAKFIRIDEPSSEDNHVKVKDAIKRTYQKLLDLNIRSAMNSGRDVLGEFYEVFLKYGNGAKEIGIVLTPRHITRFASYTLDIDAHDLVLDLACGTGGFLVSAYDEVKRKTKDKKEFENFKQNGIYGIEEQDPIISLAIVNMIFRGDGKTNMIEGNCFNKWLAVSRTESGDIKAEYLDKNEEDRIRPITKVMINPPFSQEKKEFEFIEQALNQMQDGGILFCVLPVGALVKQAKFIQWRTEMLKKNTLLSVVTFPMDLFYPVGTHTLGFYIKKGVSHNHNQNVLWVKVDKDGFLKVKGKRISNKKEPNQLNEIADIVKDFIKDPSMKIRNIEEFIKTEKIDFQDKNLELLPQVYLDEKKPSDDVLYKRIDIEMRNFISSMIKYNRLNEFKKNVIEKEKKFFSNSAYDENVQWKEFLLTDLFEAPIKTGNYHKSSELDEGKIPLVSCVSVDCGFEGFYNIENKKHILQNAITIASDGAPLTSFYHYYQFTAKDNVLLCKPLREYKFSTLLFFVTQINSLKWRFSYGRKCYENKVDQLKIFLPINISGEIDEDYLNAIFKKTEVWGSLKQLFQ
ncbi:MAG: N-6 DNA methylase [Patescibacteria group bacterium]|nr:N-6 DNA methylase [Patescibacteria group bacterium]